MNECKNKVRYEGQFEADRAAAIAEHRWGEDMESYRHGRHYHIAHVDRSLRNKHPKPEQKDYCEYCHCNMRPTRWMKHQLTNLHKKKVALANAVSAPSVELDDQHHNANDEGDNTEVMGSHSQPSSLDSPEEHQPDG